MTLTVEMFAVDAWAETTARRFAELDPGRVCMATGHTMTPFLREISELDLSGTTVFLLDEFEGLPEGDPGRCRSMLHNDLLNRANRPPTVHVPSVDPPDPDAYQALIDRGGLELAIVGLGANGHIGMNEPGSSKDSATRVVQLAPSTSENASAYGATTIPSQGVTVGMGPLLEADEVWLMVTGAGKRNILRQILTEPIGPKLPATFLRSHPRCIAFVDEAAVSDHLPGRIDSTSDRFEIP